MSENQNYKGGKFERTKRELVEEGTRDLLTGKSLQDIKQDINAKAEALGLDEDAILKQIREESGDVFAKIPGDDKNVSVTNLKVQQTFDDAIERIKNNEDPEKVLLDTEDNLERLGLDEKKRDDIIQKLLETFELPEGEKNLDEILLQEGGDSVKLPKLDVNTKLFSTEKSSTYGYIRAIMLSPATATGTIIQA